MAKDRLDRCPKIRKCVSPSPVQLKREIETRALCGVGAEAVHGIQISAASHKDDTSCRLTRKLLHILRKRRPKIIASKDSIRFICAKRLENELFYHLK